MNNWFLFKYENLQSPSVPEDVGDNFIVNELILYGVINNKVFLHNEIGNKLPMSLIKKDKILILDNKIASKNKNGTEYISKVREM